jgi:hypothetical protein
MMYFARVQRSRRSEITWRFHRPFMTFLAQWPQNGDRTKSVQQNNVAGIQRRAATQLHPLLSCRYIKEKYCNSGIAMFLSVEWKHLEMAL